MRLKQSAAPMRPLTRTVKPTGPIKIAAMLLELGQLKTFRFADSEVDAMQRKEPEADLEVDDRVHFCFALGKHFEDQKDYATSFDYYYRGNELRRQQLAFLPTYRLHGWHCKGRS